MSFDFDPTNPLDNALVSAFPSNERDSRQAIEDSFSIEHTPGTGRHVFGVGTTATRDGQADIDEGMIWFNTDRISGETVIDVYSGGAWVSADFALTDVVRAWTKTQFGTPNAITPAGGPPLEIDWNAADGPFFRATLTADSILNAPTITPLVEASMTHWTWQIIQDGTGGWDLDFEATLFIPAFGGQPDIDQTANAVSLIHITKLHRSATMRYVYRVELVGVT